MSPATHTVELQQIRDLNARLEAAADGRPTARELGMASAELNPRVPIAGEQSPVGAPADRTLGGDERLAHLFIEGPPDFPYIWAAFHPAGAVVGADVTPMIASIHTSALQWLSARFGLRHRWGTDSGTSGIRG
jgi:hypothetical protein